MNTEIGATDMANNDHYKMTVDLNVLNHLGINLYSNIAAVLTDTASLSKSKTTASECPLRT